MNLNGGRILQMADGRTLRQTEDGAAAPTPWYLAGGAPTPLAAYQPKGAANLAASYLRVAGSGGFADLDPSVHTAYKLAYNIDPPTFSADGWVFATGKVLESGIVANSNYSYCVQYLNANVAGVALVGYVNANTGYQIAIDPNNNGTQGLYKNQGSLTYGTPRASGNVIIAKDKVYVNGALAGTLSGWSSKTESLFIAIGGTVVLLGGTPWQISGNDGVTISALAAYTSELTAGMAAAIAAAMGAIT